MLVMKKQRTADFNIEEFKFVNFIRPYFSEQHHSTARREQMGTDKYGGRAPRGTRQHRQQN